MLLRTLGGLGLSGVPFRRQRPLLLLAYLALEGPKERGYLAELFWSTAANPRQSLAVALSQLRGAVPSAVASDETRLSANVECDARGLLAAAGEQEWRRVVEIYQGPFLSGVDVGSGNVELEEWLYQSREVLATCAQQALIEIAERHMAAGDASAAARLTQRAVILREDASRAAERDLARLHALALATRNPVAAQLERELSELGLAAERGVGARTPVNQAGTSHNLSRPPTPFVGRERELRELDRLLDGDARLITLAGVGGIGKTRLALRFAERLVSASRFDRVVFVPLETTDDPAAAFAQVAAAFDPAGEAEPLEVLLERTGALRTLLVLDNFEQLIAAAPRLSELLDICTGLRLLVTSRHPLGLPGETLFPLHGLALPDNAADALADREDSGGLQLYRLTARRYDPHFALTKANAEAVLRTCRLLEGAPLGIELAAALARAMPVEELCRVLEADLDALAAATMALSARHTNLRTVFEQSWRLLSEDERSALAACSVFQGGFTRSAAEAVAGMDLALLTALIDKALITHDDGRYRLHALVRQYAGEKLAGLAGEDARAHRLHAEYYADFMRSKDAAMLGPAEGAALAKVSADYANVRAAWVGAARERREDLVDGMLHVLSAYLISNRRLSELGELATVALDAINPDSLLAARLLHAKAKLWLETGDDRARQLMERAVALARSHGGRSDVARSLYNLADVYMNARDWPSARGVLTETLRELRGGNEADPLIGGCLNNLAFATPDAGEHMRLLLEAADVCKRAGNLTFLVNVLRNIAGVQELAQGDFVGALERLGQALELEGRGARRVYALAGLHSDVAYCLVHLGDYDGAERELAEATRLLRDHEAATEDVSRPYLADEWVAGHLHLARGDSVAVRTLAARLAAAWNVCETMAWLSFQDADAIGLLRHRRRFLASYQADVLGATARADVYVRSAARLMSAALASLPGGLPVLRDANTRGAAAAARDLSRALADIAKFTFVPMALQAFVVAGVAVPYAVDDGLLELAAHHPAAAIQTRRHALELLGRRRSEAAMEGAAVPAPSLALGDEVTTEDLIGSALELQWRLRIPGPAPAQVDLRPVGRQSASTEAD